MEDLDNGALISMLTGPIDEVAEPDGVLDLRRRRLARVHSIFRPGDPAVGGSKGKVCCRWCAIYQIGGKWLRESGFPVGRRYSVEVQDGELVIRAL